MPARTLLMAGEAQGGVKVGDSIMLWGSYPLEHDLKPALMTADMRAEEGYAKYSVMLNICASELFHFSNYSMYLLKKYEVLFSLITSRC